MGKVGDRILGKIGSLGLGRTEGGRGGPQDVGTARAGEAHLHKERLLYLRGQARQGAKIGGVGRGGVEFGGKPQRRSGTQTRACSTGHVPGSSSTPLDTSNFTRDAY